MPARIGFDSMAAAIASNATAGIASVWSV